MSKRPTRQPSARRRSKDPPDHAFAPLLRFLAAQGLTIERLADLADRNKSNAGRVLRTALRFERSIRLGVEEFRPQYLAALSDPESDPIGFLTGLSLFPVGVLAEPPHVSRLSSLWGIGRDLDSMLSPGQFRLVEGCLMRDPPATVVLIAPDRAAHRARFRRLCEELRDRAGVAPARLASLSFIAGPATVGWGGASTAIANGESEFALGFQGFFQRLGDGRPDVLATVMTRDTTRAIAREIAEVLERIRGGAFRDEHGGHWTRLTGTEALGPAADGARDILRRTSEALRRRGLEPEPAGGSIGDAIVTVRGKDAATGEARTIELTLAELLAE